ncbi:MAG: gamma-glutamyltransferase, partial [Alphaproteobacteria bacterium]|nr:gamma-glutamyltransferase [Alphaproteobacteria bacterium]
MAALAALVLLAACSSNPLATLNPFKDNENEADLGKIGFVKGFFGGVAVDEPRAALIGRDILSSGGSAADVAVAVTLTLAVTQSSSASLGGGGVCVVHDAKSGTTQSLDFLPGIPKSMAPGTARPNGVPSGIPNAVPSAVPGTIRGLALLHAKYGRLDWKELVSPAEKLARFGIQVSRALANDLKYLPPAVLEDPEFRRIFGGGANGPLVREGDTLKQLDLSAVLGRIRARGAGDFYTGVLARSFAAAAGKAGGGFTLTDLRAYTPLLRPTIQVPYIRNTVFHFPSTTGPNGVLAAQMMAMMIELNDWDGATPAERSHMMAEISARAYSNRTRWLREDGGTSAPAALLVSEDAAEQLLNGYDDSRHTPQTGSGSSFSTTGSRTGASFVAVDREGSAVACGLTLNNVFGTGKVAPGTGVLLSALPGPGGRGPDSLSAVLLVNPVHKVFHFAGAASGGPVAPSALVQIAVGAIMAGKGETLETAINARRAHNDGASGLTHYEQGMDAAIVNGLSERGHRNTPTALSGWPSGRTAVS